MHWLTILILGVASNLDNLGIGLAYGMKGKRMSVASNGLITLMTICVSFLSLWAGTWITHFLPMSFANRIGGMMIILIGLYTLVQDLRFKKNENSVPDPEVIDKDHNNTITWNESVFLGFLLSWNNAGMGIGAGITGIQPYLATLSIGLFSFLFIGLGTHFGLRLRTWSFTRYTEMISALFLLGIGFYECFF